MTPSKNSCQLAIVGLACRMPGGGNDPDTFWKDLEAGRCGISDIPTDRWDPSQFYHPEPGMPGKYHTGRAGTIGDVAGFDASFFGISPREADQMDPQQRLLLELAWEAFESAGIPPHSMAGRNCSVHVGISASDYAGMRQNDPAGCDGYFMLGSTLSIAANRLSHFFDLRGASMALDTACSSSLVALNEAVHAMMDGRAEMALVGGAHLLLSPYPFIGFSRASMLSEYGQCRSFAKGATGYVRAEGGGVLLIKHLDDAIRSGDSIHAIIRGSGSNNDGHTPNIAIPSSLQQASLLNDVYSRFGIDPEHLIYLEAHGTGTAVGDPIEANAIGASLGRRRKSPLPIGSVKSNIGHMEPASGMAGIIKAIGILKRGVIPPSLLEGELNPGIPFHDLNLRVVREIEVIHQGEHPSLVGVNSFGFGGTNAHVVLQEWRPLQLAETGDSNGEGAPLLIPLSARSETSLRSVARGMADCLEEDDVSIADIAYTSSLRRTHHPHRLAFYASKRSSAVDALRRFANREQEEIVLDGFEICRNPKVAFIFAGNGAQGTDDGLRLLLKDPLLKGTVDRVEATVRDMTGWSFVEEFLLPEGKRTVTGMQIIQPLCFAIQMGLANALSREGLNANAVMGHSFGELAAACFSGALSFEQAAQVIINRSAVQEMTRGKGVMAAVSLSEAEAEAAIAPHGSKIEIAAVNSPLAVTLTGDRAALTELGRELSGKGIDFRMLGMDYAFHSHWLEPGHQDLLASLEGLKPGNGKIPFYSSVTGGKLPSASLASDYWWSNLRQCVRFDKAMSALISDRQAIFIEIGAAPVMQAYMRHAIRALASPGKPLSVMSRKTPKLVEERIHETVARSYVCGASLGWAGLSRPEAKLVKLPSYPWDRHRHWFPVTEEAKGGIALASEGKFLGSRFDRNVSVWSNLIDTKTQSLLEGHRFHGEPIFPASGFVEIALEAASVLLPEGALELDLLQVRKPIVLGGATPSILQTRYSQEERTLRIESKVRFEEEGWILNATVRMGSGEASIMAPLCPIKDVRGKKTRITAEEQEAITSGVGLDYGGDFRIVQGITVCGRHAETQLTSRPSQNYTLHPASLDGAFQSMAALLKHDAPHEELRAILPIQIERMILFTRNSTVVTCRTRLILRSDRSAVADFDLLGTEGELIGSLRGVRFIKVMRDQIKLEPAKSYTTEFVPLEMPDTRSVLPEIDAILAEVTRDDFFFGLSDPNQLLATSREGSGEWDWNSLVRSYPRYTAEIIAAGPSQKERPLLEPLNVSQRLALLFAGSKTAENLDRAVEESIRRSSETMLPRRKPRVLDVKLPGSGPLSFDADRIAMSVVEMGDVSGESNGIVPKIREVLEAGSPIPHRYDLVILRHPSLYGCDLRIVLSETAALIEPWGNLILTSLMPGVWLDRVVEGKGLPDPTEWVSLVQEAGFSDPIARRLGGGMVLTASRGGEDSGLRPGKSEVNLRHWILVVGPSEKEETLAHDLGYLLLNEGHHLSVFTDQENFSADEVSVGFPFNDPEGWSEALKQPSPAGVPKTLLYLAGTFSGGRDSRQIENQAWPVICLAKALKDFDKKDLPNLILVSAGACPLKPDLAFPSAEVAPHQAALWGVGRVLRNEFPEIKCRLIDLHGPSDDHIDMALPLFAEITVEDAEDEVVLGPDRRLGVRIRETNRRSVIPPAGKGGKLKLSSDGGIGGLCWKQADRAVPKRGEVEIEVRATGLNFRDVMYCTGALPEEALENGFTGPTLGMEGAGIVKRIGAGVKNLQVGEKVSFFAPAAFASHVVTSVGAVSVMPSDWSFEEASTVPSAFFTVIYTLKYLAKVLPHEKILIHGAAGGVGLAAIQYAQSCGAEIFVTVGSLEKRRLMHLLGIPSENIFDSRSLSFADDLMARTGSQGMDIVLNSLSGEAAERGLRILRPFGRFIELGKRDFYENRRIALKPFRNNISYFGVDADQLLKINPRLAGKVFRELQQKMKARIFSPLPFRVFRAEMVASAFRLMQGGRHIGKIVVSLPPVSHEEAEKENGRSIQIHSEAKYLVIGGTRGFGLASAVKLAELGARSIILVGKRGVLDENDPMVISLRHKGVELAVKACDLSQPAAVLAMLEHMGPALDSIKGIIHAATLYDDAAMSQMSLAQFRNVVAVKAGTALDLVERARFKNLDFLVCYSSIASIFGNPGQANYAAANSVLNAISLSSQNSMGARLTVAWDAISDVGYFASREDLRKTYEKSLHMHSLSSSEALTFLSERLLEDRPDHQGRTLLFTRANWSAHNLRSVFGLDRQARFLDLLGGVSDRTDSSGDLHEAIEGLSLVEVQDFCADIIVGHIGKILGIVPAKVDINRPVTDMGMDSLTAMELRLMIEKEVGVELPLMSLASGGTVRQLASQIAARLHGVDEPDEARDMTEILLAKHEIEPPNSAKPEA